MISFERLQVILTMSSCQVLCRNLLRFRCHCKNSVQKFRWHCFPSSWTSVHVSSDLMGFEILSNWATPSWSWSSSLCFCPPTRDIVWAIFTEDFDDRLLVPSREVTGSRIVLRTSTSRTFFFECFRLGFAVFPHSFDQLECIYLFLRHATLAGPLLDSENLLLVLNLGHSWDNDSFQKLESSTSNLSKSPHCPLDALPSYYAYRGQ